jgi:hypothetical protein
MNRITKPFLGAALAVLLCCASSARADFIPWTYNWTPSTTAVFSTNGAGKITLTNEPTASAVGDSDIVATNLRTFSNASPNTPDKFSDAAYKLTLTLVDDNSKQSGSVSFSGEFNGSLSSRSSNITNKPTSPVSQSIVLGGNLYTATIIAYAPPAPPNASNAGSISARAIVTVNTQGEVPEPAGMLLAGMGASVLGLVGYRRWRQRR